ncbi:acyl-CoA dehydrogenase family protein [Nocardioides sp. C4-1]|uniref:acyl-CoA dehydrogenase family protein n=1 Tax=Nocardioides sp. C4-1 TaxID=3151851 RepID=UPI003263CF9E
MTLSDVAHPDPERVLLRAALDDAPADDRDVPGHLDWARAWGPRLPTPGGGRTVVLWELLASLGARGLQLARTVEPHLDALAILDQAGLVAADGRTWGVYAAEGRDVRVDARRTDAGWTLTGTKPWCSLAGRLSHALVTAWDGDRRGLFVVPLHDERVTLLDEPWIGHGLPDVRSTGIRLDDVPVEAVGPPGWYVGRDGFAWGGIGVAAVWFGGAVGLWRRLARPSGREPDQVALLHLGAVDAALHAARSALAGAAAAVDAGQATGRDAVVLGARTRAVVASACAEVLGRVDRALGPQPLVAEADHAARVADLRLYLRQHHGERDLAGLGRLLLEER